MPRCSVLEIETASKLALEAFGAKDWIATSVARAVADAEAHGNVICGLYYLESYCRQLATGRVSGSVDPKVTASRPGSILSDAGYGFAQPAFEAALPMAVAAAREHCPLLQEPRLYRLLRGSFVERCWRFLSLRAPVDCLRSQQCRTLFLSFGPQCGQCRLHAGGTLFQFRKCSSMSRGHRNANRRNHRRLGRGRMTGGWRIESYLPSVVRGT